MRIYPWLVKKNFIKSSGFCINQKDYFYFNLKSEEPQKILIWGIKSKQPCQKIPHIIDNPFNNLQITVNYAENSEMVFMPSTQFNNKQQTIFALILCKK